MKGILALSLVILSLTLQAQQPIIVNHNCLKLSEIPDKWIDSAKTNLYIGYGHTSHGSQLASGMNAIESFYSNGLYDWSHSGGAGQLHLFEGDGYGNGYLDHDCGYSGWDIETREYLDSFPDCNVIMWSWCGQVNSVNVLSHYLTPMNQLETEYPNVTFVYMTGHLEGLGSNGSVFIANQQIRDYCSLNNKVLFDFADIEKFSPDCDTNYQYYNADDECNYDVPGGGTSNWATNWLANNPTDTLSMISQLCTSCAHSVSLNCVKKGIACWYLWAKIAGWVESSSDISSISKSENLTVFPNPIKDIINISLLNKSDNAIVTIRDIQGKILYNKTFTANVNVIKITDLQLPKGIIVLSVFTDDMIYVEKLLIF